MISKSLRFIVVLGFLLLAAAGCANLPFFSNPAPSPIPPAPTVAPATPAEPSVPLLPPSPMATEAAPAATAVPAAPTGASRGPTLTPLPPAPPVQPGGRFTQVKIYLIALNDNGRSGPQVGCGDSAIPVVRQITPTNAPLTAAIKELLSLHDRDYGESGLYNALYQSRLAVSSVAIMNGVATIRLTGQLLQGGECDSPRIGAQLTNTALQFSTVRSVQVFINGVPLQTLLSGR